MCCAAGYARFARSDGQTTVPPNRLTIQADTGNDRNARDLGAIHGPKTPLDDMRAALRDLVVAEETYFSSHNGYTTDGRALNIFPTAHGVPVCDDP